MSNQISPEKMAIYRASHQKVEQERQENLIKRYKLGWQVAQKAAMLLKTKFKAQKVAVFGSMLSLNNIHENSDLDLAVWGLNPQDYYTAVGKLQGLEPSLSIDLIEVESAPPKILKSILNESKQL